MTERLMMFIIHTRPNWLLNRAKHLATCLVSGVHFCVRQRQDHHDLA